MTTVKLDDSALRAKLAAALVTAGHSVGAQLAGHLQRKLNASARVGTPQSERARKAAAKKRRRRVARAIFAPSAPGEAPRKRTGTLQKSVAAEVERTPAGVTVRVGSSVPYARFLEYGTRRMAARPWLRPGLSEWQPRAQRDFVVALRRALGR